MSQLIIEGVRPSERFTKTPNELIQKADLSGLAIAIASFILSVPERQNDGRPWDICLKALYRRFTKDSQYKIRLAVTELQEAGLLTIQYIRDQTGRRFADRGWLFHLDRIVKRFSLSAGSQNEGTLVDGDGAPNKNQPIQTEFKKTESVPVEPQGQVSESISLDLDESFDPGPADEPEAKPVNRFYAAAQRLAALATGSKDYEAALAKRQARDAEYADAHSRGQRAAEQATAALTSPYLNLTPQDTVKALCSEYLAPNPKPDLDRSNRDRLSAWLTDGGDLLKLIDAFKAAKVAGTCTAKYLLKPLNIY